MQPLGRGAGNPTNIRMVSQSLICIGAPDEANPPDPLTSPMGGADGKVKLWRVADGAALATLHIYADEGYGAVGDVTFALDGYAIFAGYEAGRVQMWSAMP